MTKTNPRTALIIACSIFFAFGMFNAGIGPVLGELAEQTGSSLAAVGGVLTFLFLGSLVAQVAAGPLTDRFGQRLILVVSLGLLGAGLLGFTFARSLPVMLALVFVTGLGQGGVDLGGNLVVTDAYPVNNTPVLNLLHFFFGAGAFVGPALVSLAIRELGSGLLLHQAAAVIFLFLALLATRLIKPGKEKATAEPGNKPQTGAGSVYRSAFLWLTGLFLLIYVGAEYGAGSWVTTYMNKTTQMQIADGALVTSVYWGALTLGRLAGAAVSRKMGKYQLLLIAVGGSILGSAGLFVSQGSSLVSAIAIAILGLSFGTVYPTTVAVVVDAFKHDQGKAVGLLAAMGSIGGLALPWLAGLTLERVSTLAYIIFLAACVILMLGLLFAFWKGRVKPQVD